MSVTLNQLDVEKQDKGEWWAAMQGQRRTYRVQEVGGSRFMEPREHGWGFKVLLWAFSTGHWEWYALAEPASHVCLPLSFFLRSHTTFTTSSGCCYIHPKPLLDICLLLLATIIFDEKYNLNKAIISELLETSASDAKTSFQPRCLLGESGNDLNIVELKAKLLQLFENVNPKIESCLRFVSRGTAITEIFLFFI